MTEFQIYRSDFDLDIIFNEITQTVLNRENKIKFKF